MSHFFQIVFLKFIEFSFFMYSLIQKHDLSIFWLKFLLYIYYSCLGVNTKLFSRTVSCMTSSLLPQFVEEASKNSANIFERKIHFRHFVHTDLRYSHLKVSFYKASWQHRNGRTNAMQPRGDASSAIALRYFFLYFFFMPRGQILHTNRLKLINYT